MYTLHKDQKGESMEPKKDPLIRISKALHRELKLMAVSNNEHLTALVARILDQYLERERNVKNRID